jgi:carboxypeptidase Q
MTTIARFPRRALFCTVLLVSLFAFDTVAQSPTFDERAAQIEKKIEALQKELQELRAAAKIPVASPAREGANEADIAKIRDEGLNRSQVMPTLSYLTDVIGPRLTGSPNLKRANEWTRDKMTSWGLANAHLEPWGPFGRGWSLKRFSAQIVEPQAIPLIACPKAWTRGFNEPLTAEVVYLDAKTEADLEKYKGKLKGAIVLAGAPRALKAESEPHFTRMTEDDLRRFAESKGGRVRAAVAPSRRGENEDPPRGPDRDAIFSDSPAADPNADPNRDRPQDDAQRQQRNASRRAQTAFNRRLLSFLVQEEAALMVTPSPQGEGGTIFVASASVPSLEGRTGSRTRPWSPEAPAAPPQIACNVEDYNRLVRMLELGAKLKMAVDLQVQFHDEDQMAYNTIAEIPGDDLKDEIVMLGAHLDSWHSGTGATDNGAGVAVVMEAVRILQAQGLKPRRTIRLGLWTGEEQGIFGSKAYVREHFGYYPEAARSDASTEQAAADQPNDQTKSAPRSQSTRNLVRQPNYDKLSVYFNFDNGSGKIRGIFAQENTGAFPVFRRWMAPFRDLDAYTVSLATTGGTDHLSFDAIGLPGFQFIQDPLEYMTRTHHSNVDVYDRLQADDLKQASVIMAAFVYNGATADEKMPRKPLDSRSPAGTQPAQPAAAAAPASEKTATGAEAR